MSDVHPSAPMGEPVTASRPETTAMTPGQAAHREHYARFHGTFRPDEARKYAQEAWEWLPEVKRQEWDAVAQAAITAGTGRILAELASWRRTAEKLAGERDDLGAEADQLQAARNAVAAKNAELAAELATSRERNAAIAVQLDQYRDGRDDARTVVAEMLAYLAPGRTTTAGFQGMLADWRNRAGLEGQP